MFRPSTLNKLIGFLSCLFFLRISALASGESAGDHEKGLIYYVVDRSGAVITHRLTDSVRTAITEHASQLPENTEARLVFFSRQASETRRWPVMTPEAKREFADYFTQNFVPATISAPRSPSPRTVHSMPGGPKRLYDTMSEVMEELRASRRNYRFVTLLVFSDGEDNWSRRFRSWRDVEPVYSRLVDRHEHSFIYWITLEFDPEEAPPSWVNHQPHPPGTTEIPIPEAPPQARFVAHPRQVRAGEIVQFEHRAFGGPATSFFWNFGDGNESIEKNPQHRYDREGDYTVTLQTFGPGGEAKEVQENYVRVAAEVPLTARIRPFAGRIRAGDTVEFEDLSEGDPEEREWQVNGEVISTESSASFTADEAGEVEVSLTVKRGGETDTATRALTVIPAPPSAGFVMRPEEANFGETVVLAAETEEGWEHRWTIDGELTLEGAEVEWTADRHGLLRVVHIVEGPGGLARHSDRIFVHAPPEVVPSAAFYMSSRFFHQGEDLVFRADETDEGWSHEWWIDGELLGQGPEWHWTSDRTGSLNVEHRIRIPGSDEVFSEAEELVAKAHEWVRVDFSASSRRGTFPLTVRFRDRSEGEAVAYHWDFGDGNSSSERHPVHTYPEAGNYLVTLSITNPQGQVTTSAESMSISVVPPMPLWQKVAIGVVIGIVLWVGLIVPMILTPILTPEKGPRLIGARTHSLHRPARRGWLRFLWPRSSVTIGCSLNSDIRLSSDNGKRADIAFIERSPAASDYNIRPIKQNEVYKIEKRSSLLHPGVEEKTPIKGARLLKDGDTYEIAGERLTWCNPRKSKMKREAGQKKGRPARVMP